VPEKATKFYTKLSPTLPLATIFSPLVLTKVTVTSSLRSVADVWTCLKGPKVWRAEKFDPFADLARVLNAADLATGILKMWVMKDILIWLKIKVFGRVKKDWKLIREWHCLGINLTCDKNWDKEQIHSIWIERNVCLSFVTSECELHRHLWVQQWRSTFVELYDTEAQEGEIHLAKREKQKMNMSQICANTRLGIRKSFVTIWKMILI